MMLQRLPSVILAILCCSHYQILQNNSVYNIEKNKENRKNKSRRKIFVQDPNPGTQNGFFAAILKKNIRQRFLEAKWLRQTSIEY